MPMTGYFANVFCILRAAMVFKSGMHLAGRFSKKERNSRNIEMMKNIEYYVIHIIYIVTMLLNTLLFTFSLFVIDFKTRGSTQSRFFKVITTLVSSLSSYTIFVAYNTPVLSVLLYFQMVV